MVLASTLALQLFSGHFPLVTYGKVYRTIKGCGIVLGYSYLKKHTHNDFSIIWKIPNISYRNSWVRMTLFCFGEFIVIFWEQ